MVIYLGANRALLRANLVPAQQQYRCAKTFSSFASAYDHLLISDEFCRRRQVVILLVDFLVLRGMFFNILEGLAH
jgi:hypothetical protein